MDGLLIAVQTWPQGPQGGAPHDDAAAGRHDAVLVRAELLQDRLLHVTEAVLAVLSENVRDGRTAHRLLDDGVAVEEAVLEHVAEHAAGRGLTAAHHAEQEDAGALQHCAA